VIVYVSGVSARTEKNPLLSVTADADCDGDVTVTLAPATGTPSWSEILPEMPPVVPAIDAVQQQEIMTISTARIRPVAVTDMRLRLP
jgi:hypothetical protein